MLEGKPIPTLTVAQRKEFAEQWEHFSQSDLRTQFRTIVETHYICGYDCTDFLFQCRRFINQKFKPKHTKRIAKLFEYEFSNLLFEKIQQ